MKRSELSLAQGGIKSDPQSELKTFYEFVNFDKIRKSSLYCFLDRLYRFYSENKQKFSREKIAKGKNYQFWGLSEGIIILDIQSSFSAIDGPEAI